MSYDSHIPTLIHPCAACMGFCLENTKCIRCSICVNWFHQKCCKLTNKAFNDLKQQSEVDFIENSSYICKFCSYIDPCNNCQLELTSSNIDQSLYCVTCKKRVCDDCNDTFSSEQLKSYRETDTPYYCLLCNDLYPCKVCKKQCYNDILHAPSIYCENCGQWLHHACSKLTHSQFNKLGNSNIDYICHVCIAENVPFAKISKSMFSNVVVECATKISAIKMNAALCTLCIECGNTCDECQDCPDLYRVCDGCKSKCRYLTIGGYNENIAKYTSNTCQLKLLHVNIRSLTKHISNISNMIFNDFRTPLDIICFSETKLEDPEPTCSFDSNLIDCNLDLDKVQLPGYDFVQNPSMTNAGGTGIYVSQLYTVVKRPDLNIQIEGECEALFIEIVSESQNGKNVIIGSLYRHPHDNFDDFFKAFSSLVEKICRKYWLIILGDFNIDMRDNSCTNART